jgi:glucokinase
MTSQTSWFVGVDVGGTNISAALVNPTGQIAHRNRRDTPQHCDRNDVLAAILDCIRELIEQGGIPAGQLGAIGLAVPGMVDYQEQMVEASPNILISGMNLVEPLADAFGVPVALANDADAIVLGEKWVGSARQGDTVVGIFVGTGIGGGILVNRKLLTGTRFSAAEIGHLILQAHGPTCACGRVGCFEALAGRTAIARDIKARLADGQQSLITDLMDVETERIRSGVLKKCLKKDDKLVWEVLTRASEYIALGCQTFRAIFDPDVIILGGGVMEACGDDLLPIIQKHLDADPLYGPHMGGKLLLSVLGDDAGVLGSAALAMERAGLDPFDQTALAAHPSPTISIDETGRVQVGSETFEGDTIIPLTGQPRPRSKKNKTIASIRDLRKKDIRRAIAGGPENLIIAVPEQISESLEDQVADYLDRRSICCEILLQPAALLRYSLLQTRKAMIVLTGRS